MFYALLRSADAALLACGDAPYTPGPGEEVVTFTTAPVGLATWDPATRAFLVVVPPAARTAPATMSKLDFRSRMTVQERVALVLARRGLAPDGTTAISATTAAQIEVLAEDFAAAGDIDPTDPLTIGGVSSIVDTLVALGVVDAASRDARAAALLAPAGTFTREQIAPA